MQTKKTTRNNAPCTSNKEYLKAMQAGTAASTRLGYQRDLRYFWEWAAISIEMTPLYPVSVEVVIQFILEHGSKMPGKVEKALIKKKFKRKSGPLRITTLRRYLASLSVEHAERGLNSPVSDSRINILLRRLKRASTDQSPRRKAAITRDILLQLIDTCDDTLHGMRDRALLLVGFGSGGRRRSELSNLCVEDMRRIEGGFIVTVRKSKTDQTGKGHQVPVLGEAGRALSQWLVRSGIRSGPVFRGIQKNGALTTKISGRTVNRIIKKRIEMIELNPDDFGAHSLRSGFITESGRSGTYIKDAMALSGHRCESVAGNYYREGEILRNPAAHLLD